MKIALILAAALCLLSPRARAQSGGTQGTLFFQYSSSGSFRGDHEHEPKRDFASTIARLSPANGPQLVGLDCYGVTFDPNTNRMCFARGRNFGTGTDFHNANVFYSCALDGTNVRLIELERIDYSQFGNPPAVYTPAFTPTGQILFETQDRIARMNADGGNFSFLTGAGENCGLPQQSGDTIVFEKDGVCVMNINGGARRRIASFATHYGSQGGDNYADAQLSSDGQRVAFRRDNQIYVADIDNPKSAHCVSGGGKKLEIDEFSDPVWSPDGQFLAVAGLTPSNHDVFLIELSSGQMRRLTNTPEEDELPCDWDLVR